MATTEDQMWSAFNPMFCTPDDIKKTRTVEDQVRVENDIKLFMCQHTNVVLNKHKHVNYLRKGINQLSKDYQPLDASRPWLVYWIVHSLQLLNEPVPEETALKMIAFLKTCEDPVRGGYGGGPGQMAHLATTYGAVMSLCILGSNEAYESINRQSLYKLLQSLKQTDGGFLMHEGGESDIRGVYCAAAVATILNINTPTLFDNTPQWIVSCQTYEGGFSGTKDVEAHGGYTFCGLAALVLLGHSGLADLKSLIRWLAQRQMKFEGGFSGRSNKLVDGCYSFWVGACFAICRQIQSEQSHLENSLGNCDAIQHYILQCCQAETGGCIDKPAKRADFYHTCYVLSGLSIAQHDMIKGDPNILGNEANRLEPTHPLYNICMQKEQNAKEYFHRMPNVN